MQNDDEKPNRRGQKRRKGNIEEDNNETDVQNDKGTATNPINDEDKSQGRGQKRTKPNKVEKQVAEDSKKKMTVEKKCQEYEGKEREIRKTN